LIVRPHGLVCSGELRLGLEIEIEKGEIVDIRPHTALPDPFVLSPAFVNAHSHLEYRGMQDRIRAESYWPWLRELTAAKRAEPPDVTRSFAHTAAQENRRTGVALMGEHSDRPVSGEAMAAHGLDGIVFQEVITVGEHDRLQKLDAVRKNAACNRASFPGPVVINPHAYWTVDPETLSEFPKGPLSIHVAESPLERECFACGTGAMAEALAVLGAPVSSRGPTTVYRLDALGLARPGVQFVHCCDLADDEINLLAERGVSVAHCPRSNVRLRCPPAPTREMLDAGLRVGLGMDSAASGGPVDMFAEMRSAMDTAVLRGRPLTAQEVWSMATVQGANTLGRDGWDIQIGSRAPLLKLHIEDATCTEELIARGSPGCVEWLEGDGDGS
jgi:5-methylthioadenosine/S-adenosylhomocysteine deaminase